MGSLCPFSLAPGVWPLPGPAQPPPSIWLPSGGVAAGALFIYLSQCNGVRRELASGWHSEAVPLGHRRFSWACESLGLHAAPTSCGQAWGQWQPPEGPALGSWQPLARTQPSATETDWEFRVCSCTFTHVQCVRLVFSGRGPWSDITSSFHICFQRNRFKPQVVPCAILSSGYSMGARALF